MTRDDLIRLARAECWRAGDASSFLLDENQSRWVAAFRAADGASVWFIARQVGKSFSAITMACEDCLRTPGFIVRYAALTGKSAKAIVLPTLQQVLADCPPDVRPEVREQEGLVRFQNGSVITFAGTDNEQFDRLRGPRAHLVLMDEASFYDDLERVESALLPQLTTTNGKVLYLSTPPESVGHVIVRRWHAALAAGRGQHATIHQSPRADVRRIATNEAARLGMTVEELFASTFWRREYLAELVTEGDRAALPAWNEALAAKVVGDWVRPQYFDAYQAHDPGNTGDPHASLFAYLDPAEAILVVEDELELRSAATSLRQWADTVKRKETALYGVNAWNGTLAGAPDFLRGLSDVPDWMVALTRGAAPRQPYLRVGDDAQAICHDMTVDHGLGMLPTAKHDKAMEVSNLNHSLATGKVRIHRRCVRLIEQCYSTVWNKTRSAWERTDRDHGDLVDDLTYLHRNIAWHRDCRPAPVVDRFLTPPKPNAWEQMVRPVGALPPNPWRR